MSLEAILAAIRASGQRQVDENEQRAQDQAKAILADAREEAEVLRREARERAVMPAYRERARIIHRARMERLREAGDAREAAIDTALERASQCLAGLRADPGYPAILRRLTEEALSELQGSLEDVSRARLEADPRDEALLQRILCELDLKLCVDYRLNCWGGLIARSVDGRVVVINTLESRLERAMPALRRCLAALFEEGVMVPSPTITETPAYAR